VNEKTVAVLRLEDPPNAPEDVLLVEGVLQNLHPRFQIRGGALKSFVHNAIYRDALVELIPGFGTAWEQFALECLDRLAVRAVHNVRVDVERCRDARMLQLLLLAHEGR